MKKIKHAAALLPLLVLLAGSGICQAQDLQPGVERWTIKTSLAANPRSKKSTIDAMLSLPNPVAKKSDASETIRIPKTVGGLKEGDIVTITGWLLLVALEDDAKKHRDGDFHIQIRPSATSRSQPVIV